MPKTSAEMLLSEIPDSMEWIPTIQMMLRKTADSWHAPDSMI